VGEYRTEVVGGLCLRDVNRAVCHAVIIPSPCRTFVFEIRSLRDGEASRRTTEI
jgi:hypothetical protein